jgi:hypothetical protein
VELVSGNFGPEKSLCLWNPFVSKASQITNTKIVILDQVNIIHA